MVENSDTPYLIEPEKEMEIESWLDEIIDAFRNKKVQFLFGAGMSYQDNGDGGVPLGNKLSEIFIKNFFPKSEELTKDIIIELINKYPFEILAEALSIKLANKRKGLTDLLIKCFIDSVNQIPNAYKEFASIRKILDHPKVIFTTNLDRHFKKLFKDGAISIHHNNVHEYINPQNIELIRIVYLHGTLESEKYQITEYDIYTAQNKTLINEFENHLDMSDIFVFVGYSLNDPDFKEIYRRYQIKIKEKEIFDKSVFFVTPAKNKYEYLLGQKVWESRNAKWIPYSAEKFFNLLNKMHDDSVIAKDMAEIRIKYDTKNEKGTKKLIKDIANLLLINEEEAAQYLIHAKK